MRGKVAIVTGASRGIGKAIAVRFAGEGARVVVAARSEVQPHEKLLGTIGETVAEIEKLRGEAIAVRCDVTSEASVNAMVEEALKMWGRVDVLVNNAAVDFPSPCADMPLKRWDIVLKVNLTGPFLCAKAVIPVMRRQGSGSIVNIASNAGAERGSGTVGYSAVYAVSKAGLDRFTWALAAEEGKHNIAVNAVKPWGVVSTEGMRMWTPAEEQVGWKSPASMVACAVFLAKQDASGVTGCVAFDDEYICWHGLKVDEG
jgi:NAD(P)-dependent dehydrogenase (short-subunit alcohol dehydrogenase family)